ncbi:uncharacterized protein LOC114516539 [Dendronephthya gigantea]|uniref:uncharacterized protein LOC114516539 n=1 Tax=Dendronephthya gigantea TaxID=151771 RepID=UPI00106B618F|nr:uncharacterized protein LOC114516539 [Dendronephthya gigantea]
MALATTPILNSMIRPACKRRLEKPAVVVIDDTRPSACTYHKKSLSILMDIAKDHATISNNADSGQIMKIADTITCGKESNDVFQTFCGLSFLDRYQNKATIACSMHDLDRHIRKHSWQMEDQLHSKCNQLLVRMGTIENLSSLDADLICLLCSSCKSHNQNTTLFDLLLEIGRSIWPYLKRPLWHSEPFVDFVADIFEAIGGKLEELYPKNFNAAWKEILKHLVFSQDKMSNYSRLRLLAVFEHRHRRWCLPADVTEFFREQYDEYTDTRKKEISAFLGLLSSRRKTSLTAKPGRSAADFLKRRLSQESQESDERCSTSSGDSSETLSDVNEETLEQNESDNIFSPASSTDSCRNTFFENIQAEHETCKQKDNENGETKYLKVISERRSFLLDRKKDIIKVPKKYVGRVIGSQGSVIQSIQDESDARVSIMRKENGLKMENNSTADDDSTEEGKSEKSKDESSENIDEDEDSAFQIIGTDESIKKAKQKIESIISHAKSSESHANLKRSLSDGDKLNSNSFRKSFYQDRTKVIMKVGRKYVGRVIGSGGSMIMTIEEESGAKVTFKKDRRTEEHSCLKQDQELKNEDEASLKTDKTTKDTQHEDKADDEYDFEILGTDETIRKAKEKIEFIMKLVDNAEKRPLTRSLSVSSAPRSGFRHLHRSLSCPITDWGQACGGECLDCLKGCYCRSFLLQQSKSRFSWVRPPVLALNQDVEWADFIVEKEVDESLWRPRTLSNESRGEANINFGSGENFSSGRDSPENPSADNISSHTTTENTKKYLQRKATFEDSTIFKDAPKQVDEDS